MVKCLSWTGKADRPTLLARSSPISAFALSLRRLRFLLFKVCLRRVRQFPAVPSRLGNSRAFRPFRRQTLFRRPASRQRIRDRPWPRHGALLTSAVVHVIDVREIFAIANPIRERRQEPSRCVDGLALASGLFRKARTFELRPRRSVAADRASWRSRQTHHDRTSDALAPVNPGSPWHALLAAHDEQNVMRLMAPGTEEPPTSMVAKTAPSDRPSGSAA